MLTSHVPEACSRVMFTRHAHRSSSRTMFTNYAPEPSSRTHNSNLFANYRVELYCAQVQLVYKTNLKIVFKIDSFMNRTELESSFFGTEHRAIIERINSFTALTSLLSRTLHFCNFINYHGLERK